LSRFSFRRSIRYMVRGDVEERTCVIRKNERERMAAIRVILALFPSHAEN